MVDTLYYDIDRNKMMDADGYLILDIYRLITPNMLYLFLKKKEYMCFEVKPGYFVELIYPEDE